MLITDTQKHTHTPPLTQTDTRTQIHTDQPLKSDFWIQGISKCVNPSKSPLRKLDP